MIFELCVLSLLFLLKLYNNSDFMQLLVMMIAEGRDEQPHGVIKKEEVDLTEEVLGCGGFVVIMFNCLCLIIYGISPK